MHVIDSHTGGEPTRVILDGAPDLGSGPLAERAERLARDHESFYRSILIEPRGQPAMLGALLTPPTDPSCAAGVIYFDPGAVIGMCGHGTIGLAVTLAHLGQIEPGHHKIETPDGIVSIELIDANTVRVTNVESHRLQKGVELEVEGYGHVTGDLAYGGNVFFIVNPSPVEVTPGNINALTEIGTAVRNAVFAKDLRDHRGKPVDHFIFQTGQRTFVLCPDDTYDRSPCGTGCSAILAGMAQDGSLAPGETIQMESVIGSHFQLSYEDGPTGGVVAQIIGDAFVTSESQIFFAENDPFRDGINA